MRSLIILLMLTGCATTRSEFKVAASDSLINVMASDSANQINSIFKESKPKLSIVDSNKFGSALSGALRKSGFPISEAVTEAKQLNYFVDKLDSKLYRVSLSIDKTKLSRAYMDGEKPLFISDWTIGVEHGR